MMYSPTETTYLRWYEDLVTFANGGHLSVLRYFDDNWKDCRNIWADYRRNEYFHAAPTWKTTRIDNMTASLLSHQRAVIDQVLYDIQRHGLRSRPPATIPDFLRRISALMSKYVLKRTVGNVCGEQVDYNLPKKEACTWEVFTKSSVFTCDDIVWTCTCAFCKSQYLPCQHLMFVAHNGHGFEEFPPSALPVRWNMDSARALTSQLEEGRDSILNW
ncbi:LOW QUALITY PROTEIN: hypothetical protein PHMEG_00021716 [Phytophthora megakarya]|uniref:SWIM-type domain-containing protein n=1 Tax=Phytophthora megakarya TaxID=4795 RepID=A0A225VNH1_9STRA|nr:LOW QUALITY PROTEIN: hypothetical protein PHMEG_00021716 [Phytophthora megakarya]